MNKLNKIYNINNTSNTNKLLIIILILVIIILIMIYYKKIIDKFDNLEENLYTYDKCCTEKDNLNCMKYGKTGVCNYNKKGYQCLCQNSF
jgi:uncharacterized protein YxeA